MWTREIRSRQNTCQKEKGVIRKWEVNPGRSVERGLTLKGEEWDM